MRLHEYYILANKKHQVSCDKLPSINEVEKIVSEHQDVVLQIQKWGDFSIKKDAHFYNHACPGKADIAIVHGGTEARDKIEELLSGETFFGVPIDFTNA